MAQRGGCRLVVRIASLPSRADVLAVYDYDAASGVFTWKVRGAESFHTPAYARYWNARYAGTEAGGEAADGYTQLRVGGKCYLAHRLAWMLTHGSVPTFIDHINGDRRDNRIENLRLVSHDGNSRNRKRQSNSRTGVNGVLKRGDRFVAHIRVQKRSISLGTYSTLEEAAVARRSAEELHGFHANHGVR